jgi:two-component system, NtrC family, nitrogen regulation sensor histidine kinase GlnL
MKRQPPPKRLPTAPPQAHEIPSPAYAGLDLLPSAVLLLDAECRVIHGNPAAESLIESSLKNLLGQSIRRLFTGGPEWDSTLDEALDGQWSHRTQELVLSPAGRDPVPVSCMITPVDQPPARLLAEFRVIDQQLKIAREERLYEQAEANRQLVRNLAHEIKNPLGGIRGAAQLLEHELPLPHLREYTQVIIKESDRLQTLMDRMLTPHRPPHITGVNVHEVLERVRSLLAAEFPGRFLLTRDYDASLPDLRGDKERLIQAVLNIARNAAQALIAADTPEPEIRLKTRIARNVILAKERYRLALELHISDNGPGVPEEIRDRIFHPLVSGREGGSGLGLTLAQTFVQQHHGTIECDSRPGYTCFKLLLPLS